MPDDEAARLALRTKRAEVIERLRGLDEGVADIVEAAKDSNLDDEHDPEGTTIAASRAQLSALGDAGRRQLVAIDRALARIDRGEYGRCTSCGGPIAEGRLEALPETPLCIACASRQR